MGGKPHYRVAALDKKTDDKAPIGAAWVNADGTISVILNPFVTIRADKNLLITLFPEKEKL